MTARNGEHGYGWVTKLLHWLTVALLVAQFIVGYLMDDEGGQGRGRGRGRGGDSSGSGHGRGQGGGGEEEVIALLPLHVGLGTAILVLAIVRVFWRVGTPLPPWAESLSAAERRIAHHTERALLVMLFVIPPTGLVVLLGDDDLLGLHVAAHLVFFVALAAHVGLVLGPGAPRTTRVAPPDAVAVAQVPRPGEDDRQDVDGLLRPPREPALQQGAHHWRRGGAEVRHLLGHRAELRLLRFTRPMCRLPRPCNWLRSRRP